MKSKRFLLKYRGTVCLNCQQPLDVSERYCHNCGQLNSTKKLSFNDFFNEYFSGIFAYDSRFYRTIQILLFQPGKIAKDYITGKRQRYVNPYKFFLNVSIIFFVLWGFSTSFNNSSENRPFQVKAGPAETGADEIQISEEDAAIENLIFPTSTEKPFEEVYVSAKELDSLTFQERLKAKWNIFSFLYNQKEISNSEEALQFLKYPGSTFNHWLYKKVVDLNYFAKNPNIFLSYFIGKLPFIIFFFLPVFALFIWLLYVRRPFFYMEHLVFSFYTQSVCFILYGIGMLLDWSFSTGALTDLALLAFLIYLFLALKKFYDQGWVKTALKFIVLNVIFFILAGTATIISVLASFAIY